MIGRGDAFVGCAKISFALEELQRRRGCLISGHRLNAAAGEAIGVTARRIAAAFRQLTKVSFDEIFDGGSFHRVAVGGADAGAGAGSAAATHCLEMIGNTVWLETTVTNSLYENMEPNNSAKYTLIKQ